MEANDNTDGNKFWTLAAMSLGFAVVQLDVTIVNTGLHSIGASVGGGVAALQWVVNAYTIAFAALILTAGALGDRVGAKKIFMMGFALFTAASLACALAPSIAILIAARALQGFGAAILVPNSLALLNHSYREETGRRKAVGIWAAGASIALTLGPLAGGCLIALAGWRTIFLVNIPIGLTGLWLTWRYAAETQPTPGRELDLWGQITTISALGCLAGAMIEGGVVGWLNRWILSGLLASAVSLVLFILRERHAQQPMLPLSLFNRRLFAASSLIGLLVNIAFYGLIFVLSLYFQTLNGLSPLATGLAFLPMTGAVLPTNLWSASFTQRFGATATIAAGAIIAALGCIGLLNLDRGTNYWTMCAQLMAIGGGLGLLVPALTSALLGTVEKERSGIASGVLNATRQTGSVLGVALFGSFVGKTDTFLQGARLSLVISALVLIGASAAIIIGQEK
jgi:MFS transporter, DHA2 family, methylenomycin A resistance protein